ncbi:MAG TPA: flagellar export chaperone FliS [Candidatus Krumholzibacteria bacterium]|nr:flagellar export chaperone FliS [Candidatus Krumholzibacteria bacterium]
MDNQRAVHQYTATAVETGSPARLVAMLYQGALKYIGEAQEAIANGDTARKGDRINRAMRIVQELGNALDESVAPELVGRLALLYEYVEHELLQASTYNRSSHLENCLRVLGRLARSWEELAEQNVQPGGEQAASPSHTESSAPSSDSADPTGDRVPSLSISA